MLSGMEAQTTPARSQARYARVKSHLKQGLEQGDWAPGEQMPSEAQLVAQFGVSRMTVTRALRELQSEGLVERVQGAGTFAAQVEPLASTLTIRDLRQEISDRGHLYAARIHFVREEAADARACRALGLALGAPVFHSLVAHLDNGVPLQCEDRYVNPACVPGYLGVDFERTTATDYLLQVAPMSQASYSIRAALPSALEARLLAIDRFEPCLIIDRRTSNLGIAITSARLVHPGLRYRLDGEFRP